MRMIVTGGAGFIGSHLVDFFVTHGDEVIVVDNLSTGRIENVNPKAKFFRCDITKYDQVRRIFRRGADCIFHLAALPKVPYSLQYPYATNKANLDGTLVVFELATRFGIGRLIYSSSSSVYGRQTHFPVNEDMNVYPLSPYATQKFAAENHCRIFSMRNAPPNGRCPLTVSLRYFNVYGPRQNSNDSYAAAISIFLKNAAEGRESIVYGDGEQRRDFTHVSDVVRANVLAFESNKISSRIGEGDVINIGCGKNYSINQVAEMIGTKYTHGPARLGEPRVSLADITKAKKLLDWEPKVDLLEGIAELKKLYGLL